MKHLLSIAAAALLATHALAADSKPKKKSKAEIGRAEKEFAARAAKSAFISAIEACATNRGCDSAVLTKTSNRFMRACEACASSEACEADRAKIEQNKGSRVFTPCSEAAR